jgi:hypothetical protein
VPTIENRWAQFNDDERTILSVGLALASKGAPVEVLRLIDRLIVELSQNKDRRRVADIPG